jgi:ribose/xylose/arabinose/galactoside ABC-type transport system permease subunit
MAFQMPELGLLSLGMMVTILSGGINLSIVANANFFGIITMTVFAALTKGAAPAIGPGWATVIALGAGTACGLLIGIINGFLVGTVGVSAILATLGTMTLVTGVNVLLTHGYTLSGVPSALVYLGNGAILNVPLPLLIFLGCSLILAFILNRTILGYSIFMLGSNPEATKYGGINNAKVILRTYVLSSVFAICASIVMMGRFNSTGADYGGSYVLVTVLACVLGGVDPSGGFGKVLGLVIAIVVLGIIGTSLNLIWSDPNLALVIWGAILILYMGIRYAMSSYRSKEQGPTAQKGDIQAAGDIEGRHSET